MNNIGVFSTHKTRLGFVGIFSLKENGKLIWSKSTGIHRLTRKAALNDAKREWVLLGGYFKPINTLDEALKAIEYGR